MPDLSLPPFGNSCRAAQRTARCLCDRTCLRSRRARTSTPIRRPRRHSRSEAEILRHLGRLHRLQADLARARAPPISPGLPCPDDRIRGPPRGARYTSPAGGGNPQSPAGALLGAQSGRSSLNHETAPRRSAEPESPGAPHGQSAGKGDHFLTFSSRRDGGRSGSALPRRPDRPSNSQWNELSRHHDGGEGHCHTGKDIRGQRPRGSERRARAHPGSVRQPSGPFPCRQPTQCRPDGVPHVVRVCPLDRRIPSSLCGEEIARTGCVERLVPEPVSQRARTFPITIRFDPVANSSIPQPRPPLARALASLARLH